MESFPLQHAKMFLNKTLPIIYLCKCENIKSSTYNVLNIKQKYVCVYLMCFAELGEVIKVLYKCGPFSLLHLLIMLEGNSVCTHFTVIVTSEQK